MLLKVWYRTLGHFSTETRIFKRKTSILFSFTGKLGHCAFDTENVGTMCLIHELEYDVSGAKNYGRTHFFGTEMQEQCFCC